MNSKSIRWIQGVVVLQALTLPLLAIGQEAPAVKVRLLDTRAFVAQHNCFMASDGSLAVIGDGGHERDARYALWNLDTGKLVRYLSAEQDKGTAPYAGDDSADFGTRIVFERPLQSLVFSADNKLVAGFGLKSPVRVWEVSSGKLVRVLENRGHHPHTFRFVDDRHIAAKFKEGTGIEIIDAASGKRRTLLEPTNYESYGGGILKDDFTLVSVFEVFSLSMTSGKRTVRSRIPPGSSRMAPAATWYSADGSKFLILRAGLVEVWDATTWTKEKETVYVEDLTSHQIQAVARSASLLAIVRDGNVELWDAIRGEFLTLVLPHGNSSFCAMSDDARRIVFGFPTKQAVVVELSGPPTTAAIDVAGQLAADQPQAMR